MGSMAKAVTELAKNQAAQIAALEATLKQSASSPFGALRFSGGEPAAHKAEKGLGFARAVRALAYAELNHLDPMAAADTLDQKSGVKYGDKIKATVKALGESTVAAGGVFAPDEFSADFIELLRPELALIRAGIRRIPMSRQTLTRGRQALATSLTWMSENAPIAYSQPGFDSPQLSLKKAAILVALSNDLIRDEAVSSDVIVRDDLVKVGMLGLDLAGIRGSGAQGSPKGIRNWIPAGNVTGSSAGSGTPTLQNAAYDFEVKLTGLLNGLNVPQTKRVALLHPRTVSGLKQLKDGIGGFPIAREINEHKTIFGVPFQQTTQIPINLSGGGSGGSAESEIYVGEATEVEMGEGIQPTVEVSREAAYLDGSGTMQSAFDNDQTLMRMILRDDFILRHDFAWAVVNGCTYGA